MFSGQNFAILNGESFDIRFQSHITVKEVPVMDNKKLIPVIAMASVAIMVVWGMFVPDGWNKSWLAVFLGGIAIAIVSIMNKDGGKGGKSE